MRIERRDGAVLVISRLVAPGAAATTLGRFVFVKPSAVGSERLVQHELVHVRQWRDLGVAGFLCRYLGAYARWRLRRYPHWAAYRRIPQEIEASWVSSSLSSSAACGRLPRELGAPSARSSSALDRRSRIERS